ncbi:OB-fold protein [Arthrobacter sp. CP30]
MAQQYQPAYYQPPVKQGNGFGVTALVLGIVAIVASIIPILGIAAFILGPLAVIFGIVGLTRAHKPKGTSITGLVLGILSIIIAATVTSVFFGAMSTAMEEGTSGVSQDGAAPPADAKAMTVEAATLLADFEGNEAAADAKYSGQVLEVAGSVSKVDTEFLDDTKYVVRIDDGAEFSFTTVNCNDVPTDQAAAAVPDTDITIRGTFEDGGDLGIELMDCVVL